VEFKDYFSSQAARYASIRPDYPESLIDFVAGLVAQHGLAWDCATGNGQAAIPLAAHFSRVVATDASESQVEHAPRHPGVEYRVATAEASGLPTGSVDLVTVAQALHWLDRDRFYAEVRRVLAPGGALAVWSYGDPTIADDAGLDAALQRFNHETVGAYWPAGRGDVGEGYLRFSFPFAEVKTPRFRIEREWTLAEFGRYVRSWSSTVRYVKEHGADPVSAFEAELRPIWGGPDARHSIRWPITLRAGH
jgi:ubiquinone/menaquinone biosynthesis C-methylase UbiE